VTWRIVILVPYVVLAAVVAVAYGVRGFVTLMYSGLGDRSWFSDGGAVGGRAGCGARRSRQWGQPRA